MSVHMTGEEWRQTMAENGTAGDAGGGARVELDLIRPVTLVETAHVIVHYWVALKLCITRRLVFFVHLFTTFFL
jgi:hypothetical protein